MKKLLAMILVLTMVFSLCACGAKTEAPAETAAETTAETAEGGEPTPVTLRVYVRYSDDDTIKPYDYAVECLKEDMPWVTLELEPMPADDGVKLKSMVATGDLPDIFALSGSDLLNSMIQAGAVVDLTENIEANGYREKVLTAAESKLIHESGAIYTLPYTGTEVALLFVNPAIFEQYNVEYPTTIDEWVAAAEIFAENGLTTLPIFAKEAWIASAFYDALVTRYIPEGTTALHYGTASIRDEGYLKAAQDLVRLSEAGAFPAGVTTLNYEQAAALWYDGGSAMFFSGQWEIDSTQNAMGTDIDWIPIPAATEESFEAAKYNFVGGKGSPAGLSVSAWSENFDVAVDVACYLAEKYAEYNFVKRGSSTIAVRVDKPMEVEPPVMLGKLAEWMPNITGTTELWSTKNAELGTVIGEGVQSMLAGVMTAEEFIESVALVLGE